MMFQFCINKLISKIRLLSAELKRAFVRKASTFDKKGTFNHPHFDRNETERKKETISSQSSLTKFVTNKKKKRRNKEYRTQHKDIGHK